MKKKKVILILFSFFVVLMLSHYYEENYSLADERTELAFTIDGEYSETLPSKESGYRVKSVVCDNGAEGIWNEDTWSLFVKNLTSTRTKCYINFGTKYEEEILHGTDPVIKEGLIPVTIDNSGVVHKANLTEEWYSYANQRWANAVILEDESVVYQNGEEIPESNIESYFVWIPRYKYKLFNLGEYTGLTSLDSKAVQDIDIVFGTETTDDSREGECTTPMLSGETGNCKVGDYMTHPAFLSFNVNGLWVGKFETGYKGAASTTEAKKNENNSEQVQIKPNVYSWRYIQPANAHLNAYNYKREYDSHMMKNTEWGAVAYLQHSVYGSRASVRINNNSAYITGYAAVSEPIANTGVYSDYQVTSLGGDGPNTLNYKNPLSVVASTTNNYSGVYDMSGGAWEFALCAIPDTSGILISGKDSGFNGPYSSNVGNYVGGIDYPSAKYYDKYTFGSELGFDRRILGDATGEMGPFAYLTYEKKVGPLGSWYQDEAFFISNEAPWIMRGGRVVFGSGAGQFTFGRTEGYASINIGFRVILSI